MASVAVTAQWGMFLPLAYVVGPYLGYGLLVMWVAQIVYRCGQALIFLVIWRRGTWRSIKV